MTKTLVIIRHAKTETQRTDQQDFDRNLTDRGRNDAAVMAERLKQLGLLPDLILSSSANRTIQTSRIMAEVCGYPAAEIQTQERLYLSSSDVIEHTLMSLPDQVNTCYLVAHNPGVSQFVYDLQKEAFIGEMPTAAVAVVRIHAGNWQELPLARKQFLLFDHPKK